MSQSDVNRLLAPGLGLALSTLLHCSGDIRLVARMMEELDVTPQSLMDDGADEADYEVLLAALENRDADYA